MKDKTINKKCFSRNISNNYIAMLQGVIEKSRKVKEGSNKVIIEHLGCGGDPEWIERRPDKSVTGWQRIGMSWWDAIE